MYLLVSNNNNHHLELELFFAIPKSDIICYLVHSPANSVFPADWHDSVAPVDCVPPVDWPVDLEQMYENQWKYQVFVDCANIIKGNNGCNRSAVHQHNDLFLKA